MQEPVGRGDPGARDDAAGVADQVAVGQQYPLGPPGAARGELQHCRIVGRERFAEPGQARSGSGPRGRLVGGARPCDGRAAGRRLAEARDPAAVEAGADQGRRHRLVLALQTDAARAGGVEAGAHRLDGRVRLHEAGAAARLHDAEERGDGPGRARPEQADDLAAGKTRQGVRDGLCLPVQVGVGHRTEPAEQGDPSGARMAGEALAQQVAQGGMVGRHWQSPLVRGRPTTSSGTWFPANEVRGVLRREYAREL